MYIKNYTFNYIVQIKITHNYNTISAWKYCMLRLQKIDLLVMYLLFLNM